MASSLPQAGNEQAGRIRIPPGPCIVTVGSLEAKLHKVRIAGCGVSGFGGADIGLLGLGSLHKGQK